MVRTKQTPREGASHRPGGMTTATFTSTGRGEAAPEETPEVDTEEDLPLVLEDAVKKPKEGKQGASKSKGKKPAQATEGAEAPPEETPPDPKPTEPHTDPAPTEPQPGTSKAPAEDPSQVPTDEPAKPATTNPDEDEPPAPTKYVEAYQAAGKEWLDSVVKDGEAAYTKLFDKLLVLGDPYIDNFDQVDKEQVFKCIRDKTGRFLDDNDFVMYIETEEEKKKPKYVLTGDTKAALTDYCNAVHTLCEAQQNFAKSTQVLEKKITDKDVFLGTIAIRKSGDQNSRRNGEAGGQDLQTADADVPPTKLQKDQPQCQRTNQNDGHIHVLRPVRTDHWHKSITDRLCHGLQSPNDAIQETDNREETARQTRQVERGKRRIKQKPGRCCRNGRCYTGQKNKEGNQISNSNESDTQRQRQEKQIVRRSSKSSEQIGRTVRLDVS